MVKLYKKGLFYIFRNFYNVSNIVFIKKIKVLSSFFLDDETIIVPRVCSPTDYEYMPLPNSHGILGVPT
jgi:hypothetical protein